MVTCVLKPGAEMIFAVPVGHEQVISTERCIDGPGVCFKANSVGQREAYVILSEVAGQNQRR